MSARDVIGIGASLGGVEAIRHLLKELPPDLAATIFIVLHVGTSGRNLLADIFNKESALPVAMARDGEAVQRGQVYVAPTNKHLLVIDNVVRLGHGPRENMARPAIDPLFRSLGACYGPRTIGVVLTGMLNDGASGLADLKRCGGLTVVQNPADAIASEMPTRALETVTVDYRAPLSDLPDLLVRLSRDAAGTATDVPSDIQTEVAIALGRDVGPDATAEIADLTPLTCPDCGGVLSQVKREPPLRFRCQVGHAYTAEALSAASTQNTTSAIRVALRVLQERVVLAQKMADDARRTGRLAAAASYDERCREYFEHIALLRNAVD